MHFNFYNTVFSLTFSYFSAPKYLQNLLGEKKDLLFQCLSINILGTITILKKNLYFYMYTSRILELFSLYFIW